MLFKQNFIKKLKLYLVFVMNLIDDLFFLWANFFRHLHRFNQFFSWKSYKKKIYGMIFFLSVIIWVFFLEIQKLRRSQPKEKNRYHKKKDISFDIAFFCRIGHKTWLSCFSCFSRLLNMFSLFFLRILLVSNVLCPSLHSQKVMFFYFALPVIMHVLVSILI